MNKYAYVLIAAAVTITFLVIVLTTTREEAREAAVKCAILCDPYVVESCGKNARTATCKTTKGYAVRMLDESGEIKTDL